MKKIRILSIVLVIALLFGLCISAFAVTSKSTAKVSNQSGTKEESVYVISNADGSAKSIIVSEEFQNATQSQMDAVLSQLTDVENVKDDNCFRGNIEKDLPVDIKITYSLDGEKIQPEALAGKSGHVTVRFDYENKQYEEVTVDGKKERLCVPFAALTGTILDGQSFSNVEVVNGKVISDGDKKVVAGLVFPGLQESLQLDEELLDLPRYIEFSADVENFALDTCLTVVTNSLLTKEDTKGLTKLSDLTGDVDALTDGVSQLTDGVNALYEGLETLLTKCSTLKNGVDQIANGLSQLDSNSAALNDGAQQVFNSLLSMANEQLTAAGLDAPTLTIANYADVFNGVLAKLDNAGTLAEEAAREKVTQAVNAEREAVKDAVTLAVTQEVKGKVTQSVRQQVWEKVLASQSLTPETYEAGVAAGMISQEVQTQLDTALTGQMESDAVKAQIEGAVQIQMETEAVQATVTEKTQEQIDLLIAQAMASSDVQAQILAATQQASEGAVSLRTAKQQLDSYYAFYAGLRGYTGGVSTAASGAKQLQSNLPALVSGVSQLKDGAGTLKEGMKTLSKEGIDKLVSLLDGKIGGITERLQKVMDISERYHSFTDSTMAGSVKFIYRTEAIGADTE